MSQLSSSAATPPTFEGILIDMDGVLLDTERVAEACWRAAEKETGFRMPDGFYFSLIGLSIKLIIPRLKEVMDPACDIDAFIRVTNRLYDHALTHEPVPVKTGARELLEYTVAQGIPTCLATSTSRKLAERKLSATGLIDLLPMRVCGDEIEHGKPAPDIYLEAASRLGKSTHCLLAIEDSVNGLTAALSAGCRTIHVPDLSPVPLALQSRTNWIYRSLADFCHALERGELEFVARP